MRRGLFAAAAVAMLVGLVALLAVDAYGPTPAAVPAPEVSPTPEVWPAPPNPPPLAAPAPPPQSVGVAPLTGLPLFDPAPLSRPVLAVKIDNAAQARPPTGLEQADIVFEELVEGGVTRFLALYHSIDPGTVGPVRSARDVDADLLPAFQPVFAISGAAPGAQARLQAANLRVFQEGRAPSGGFSRSRGRQPPYNLFARPLELWRAGIDLSPPEPPWTFAPAQQAGGRPVATARMAFSDRASAAWTWDGVRRTWLRQQDGRSHVVSWGGQVDTENVVVAMVPTGPGGGVDAGGYPTNAVQVIGEGSAVVLRDGLAYDARWRKTSAVAHFEFLTVDGLLLPLAPGRTWVELLPAPGGSTAG